MGILFFFIDGLGIGENDASRNPLAAVATPNLNRLTGEPLVKGSPGLIALDACLGVDGLPQSATGQTSLFTGINAPAAVGRHVQGFPNAILRDLISTHNIYRQLGRLGLACDFANAYTPNYQPMVQARKWRHSVTTVAAMSAGLQLHSLEDITAGKAVYQDITGHILRAQGYEVPILTPFEAGLRLAAMLKTKDFVLFEFFQSDLAGHSRDFDRVAGIIRVIDETVGGIMAGLSRQNLLVICSDHGNIEDMNCPTHTTNPVPFIVWGQPEQEPAGLTNLTGVVPWIVRELGREAHT